MHRIMVLEAMQANPFVMPMDKDNAYQQRLARWCNRKAIFRTVKWADYK